MQNFATIKARAVERKGGEEKLEQFLKSSNSPPPITSLGDDRILSEFSKRIFQAGFNWSVVENKWPNFERAFHNFDLGRNAMMFDEDLDSHLQNKDIVRNGTKIISIRDNAIFLSDLAMEHGSAAKVIGEWPLDDHVGLLDILKTRGSRLGGTAGQYSLRFLGRDCFILSKSVVAALQIANVIDGPATSKKARKAIQQAFNDWHAESGESYTNISRTLGFSING